MRISMNNLTKQSELKSITNESIETTIVAFDSIDFIKLVGELSIPGVSKVASPLGKIFELFKPEDEDEVKKLVERALEKINDGYNMVLRALTEKAMQIYADNIDTEVTVIASRIKSNPEKELTDADVGFLSERCDTIFRNLDHVFKEGTILLNDFEKQRRTAEGTLISLVGEYTRIVLSCYQIISIGLYGFNMISELTVDDETETVEPLNNLINEYINDVYEKFSVIVNTIVPDGYPSWCEAFFTQSEMTFRNKKYSDKYLFAPNETGFDYGSSIYLLFNKTSKIDGHQNFRFNLVENQDTEVEVTKWWEMVAIDENKDLIKLCTTDDFGVNNRVYLSDSLSTSINKLFEFNVTYYNEYILINPLVTKPKENLAATTYRDVTIIYKEDSERYKWICE